MHGEEPTPWELDRRMSAMEAGHRELRELVDGQESWSHRRRLHAIENRLAGEDLLATALNELRTVRAARLRADVTLLLAAVAIVVSIFHPHIP